MFADKIIKGGAIFDSVRKEPFSGYVAVKGNRILEVGRGGQDASHLTGPDTQTLTFQDETIMAGFHDSHTHLLMAGLFNTYVYLVNAKSEEEAVELTKAFDAENGGGSGWVYGFGWYHVFWESKAFPTHDSLDKAFPDRPVCLLNAEAHGVWANAKAMELAGVTKDTKDPFGGEIIRDADGRPTGVFLESAAGLITKHAFVFTPEQEKMIIKSYLKGAAAYGITAINDVQPYFHGNMGSIPVYSELDKSGELTVRLHVAPDLLGDLDEVAGWREAYRSDRLRVEMLKQFLDGVYTTHTALVLEEYTDAPGNMGISLNDVQAIQKAVPEGHKRGFSIKLHCCGDMAARMALDYYEAAIKTHGRNKARHAIEHAEKVSDKDMPRFRELEVIASVQPEHMALTAVFAENPYDVVIGTERFQETWPLKTLYDTTGVLAFGSDCPVVSNNPFLEIYRAVTRVHNDGEPKGGWNPSQKLTMYEALRSYTYGSAYGVSREYEMGTLQVGKFADIVVIDRNLFTCSDQEVLEASVKMTMMDGNIIYRKG